MPTIELTIELTIVAARRPSLLTRTIESFHQRLFRNFEISNALINIDPIWGSQQDADECANALKRFFPNASVFTPATPCFSGAIKRLWSHTNADLIFHLEDDWLLAEDLTPAILNFFKDPKIGQVSLMAKERNWDRTRRGDFQYIKRRPTLGPIKLPFRKKIFAFTTAPSFIRGEMARRWASLMNEQLDPEKQTYMGVNPPLEKFLQQYRNYIYPAQHADMTIVDIGREWRDARKIEKRIVDSQSVWFQT